MNGVTLPSYASNAYLYGPTLAAAPAAAPAAISPFSVLLAQSPLPQPSGPPQSALDALLNISESGTPAGSPAPPSGGFTAGRGLGNIAGMAGSLAGGPLGGAFGRAAGSAIGAAADAARANAIAEQFNLGQIADPATAAGRAAAQAAANAAASMGLSALGISGIPGVSQLTSQAINSAFGTPSYSTDLTAALGQQVANMDLPTALDYEDMALGRQMQLMEAIDTPPSDTAVGMDAGHASGTNPSTASSDYGSPGGFGGAKRGGLATPDGFKGPEKFAQGGTVLELQGGGKIAVGPGGGLDDLIPTSINGRRAAALSDGEFVVPADVVSMMGDGSSNAGARRLYDLVRQIREAKTGTSRQAGPLPVGEILKRTMR